MIVARERYEQYSLPKEDRRLVRRPRHIPQNRKGQAALVWLVCVIFCMGCAIAFYYAQVLITGYKIFALEKKLDTIGQETTQLHEQVMQLSSLEYIEIVAKEKLGMVASDNKNVIQVEAATIEKKDAGIESEAKAAEPEEPKEALTEQNRVLQAFANLLGAVRGS